ncbi:D-alanyl-D-alanine carboxypeptidase family protein [Paenibacillus sp. GCM10012307]|uniref:serine-type D-Ala-D-Ala carboxypeptidase n=1 Tax=Paenibacillus roseus TaxID=2798579 RepID=A0A934J7D1_9BACL|nr:D-alanyl-D-alanine carboxypeptidase family protein [Paenibacillus roseus]MBJ6361747.1 D-alanyl-D-alanine carboxypeptidase [Paenibacillus roseus]
MKERNELKRSRLARLWQPAIAAFLAVCVLMMSGIPAVSAAEEKDEKGHVQNELGLAVSSAILMDAATGQILFSANADEALPPASMSKMMTEYIVMEEIKAGNLKWEDVVTVGRNAATTTRGGSHVFLAEGEKYTVKELFIAMAVGSANDASIALAEKVAGTEEAFAQRMNTTAQELGLETARFINATGLSRNDLSPEYQPESISGETVMSAKDAAMLAYHILKEHPEFLEFSSIPSYKFRERDDKPLINYNYMLESNKDNTYLRQFAYEGLDGMKTGHTKEAKYCFTGTAERNGMRLISVVMGTDSNADRFRQSEKLLDYGFDNFALKTVVPPKSGVETLENVKVKKGVKTEVKVVTQQDISFIVKKNVEPKIELLKSDIKKPEELVAPLPINTVVGTVTYQYTDADGKTAEKTVNLITNEEVNKASWWRLMFRGIKDFFVSIFKGIVDLF